ncbi:MAG: hypothetical protein OXE85_00005, partial [Roseovarius sp.]|nr:hypothetical protein [Roseovarius sp.]
PGRVMAGAVETLSHRLGHRQMRKEVCRDLCSCLLFCCKMPDSGQKAAKTPRKNVFFDPVKPLQNKKQNRRESLYCIDILLHCNTLKHYIIYSVWTCG